MIVLHLQGEIAMTEDGLYSKLFRRIMYALLGIWLVYFGTYYYLSRRGMQEAKEYGMGKYCFSSVNGGSEDRHMLLYRLFLPLVRLELWMESSDMQPGSFPLTLAK